MSLPFQPPTFTIVMRGYDARQVDELIDRIAAAHADPATANAVAGELRSVKLPSVLRGYNAREVDEFLAKTAATLAAGGHSRSAEPTAVPSLGSRPRGERFPKRFRSYRTGDVDAFVERVGSTLNTTLTSHEAQTVQFGSGFLGYDVDAVDDWIEQVRAHLIARGR